MHAYTLIVKVSKSPAKAVSLKWELVSVRVSYLNIIATTSVFVTFLILLIGKYAVEFHLLGNKTKVEVYIVY